MNQGDILILVKAGFTADDIKLIAPEYFEQQEKDSVFAPSTPSIVTPAETKGAEVSHLASAPAAGEQEPVPGTSAGTEAPAAAPAAAPASQEPPAWFGSFMAQYNEDQARMERSIQAGNVLRADAHAAADYKTPEQLMAEAYHAIVD